MKQLARPIGLAFALAAGMMAAPSSGQERFPSRPVEIVVPFSAGGSTDLGARTLAHALQKRWGQPVKVVNKAGGNTVPAVDEVMHAKPDGHTVLMDGSPSSTLLGVVVKSLPYKVTDRTFIVAAMQTPMIFIVPADSPTKTLLEVVRVLKASPETFVWTSLGVGTIDFAARQLFKAAGVDVRKTRAIPLKGGSDAATQTAAGNAMLGLGSYSSIYSVLNAGKVRAIAVAAPSRHSNLPDVPTAKEIGFPGVEVVQWNGFSGPPGIPARVTDEWSRVVREILKDQTVVAELAKLGIVPYYVDGREMKAFVDQEMKIVQELWTAQ